MVDHQPLGEAQQAVGRILSALGVKRVIFVDDESSIEATLENALAAVENLSADELRGLIPEFGSTIPDDVDVRKQKFRDLWGTWGGAVQHDRCEAILATARLKSGGGTDDPADATVLNEVIPGSILLTLTPSQWDSSRAGILLENSKQPTLFLFDQDLSKGGGDREGGIKIIASLLAGDSGGTLICGLLTHTATPENQLEKWDELSHAYGVDRDRFIVIPKQWLSKDPLVFAQMLKLVTLAPDFTAMKEKVRGITAEAATTAASKVEKITIYDLDHIVFRVSAEEGLWEPDMLFRLHELFQRIEARHLAHAGGEIENLAKRMRSVSQIPTKTTFVPASSTWELQRQELYEPAEYINQNHLPIEVGDIFARTVDGGKKQYILLSQPCDLMVRSDGKRHPEIEFFALAEIVSSKTQPCYAEELPYFGKSGDDPYFVKVKRVHHVRSRVLDLCVFDQDGGAAMSTSGSCPDNVRPAWKARHTIIKRVCDKLLERLCLLFPAETDPPLVTSTKAAIRIALENGLLQGEPFKGTVETIDGRQTITYNCQRVGRLSRDRAYGLLMAYTSCLSRPAYDRDFGPDRDEAGEAQ